MFYRELKYDQFNGTLKCAYTYLADGTKVMVQDNASSLSSNGYLYLGSMVFKKTGTGYAFESTDFGGGRIINVNGTLSPYYYATDHLGSVRAITDASGNVTERNDYYAFGKRMTTGGSYPVMTSNRWKYNGKEVQTTGNVNWLDYGAREYDEVIGRWTRPDPMSEKYYFQSPNIYALDNPILYIDPNGREVWIEHRKGFLGFGGKEALKYNNGKLYNKNGSAYTGKVNGFLKKTINAIGSLNQTEEGASIITELQSSSNVFTVKNGTANEFKPDSPLKAGANLTEVQDVTGNTAGSTGSGGTIFWNPSSINGGFDLSGGTTRPAYIGLGHEMGHGSDANQGLLYPSSDYTNGITDVQYKSTYQGLLKSEWNAVYHENLIRKQAGIPLRTNYGIDVSTGTPLPTGPRLLDTTNQPLNY